FNFTLNTPENTDFKDSFTLEMSYCNGVEADGIYYFNEETEKWEKQESTFNDDDLTITSDIPHLSTYGVFAIGDMDELLGTDNDKNDEKTNDEKTKGEEDEKEVVVEDGDDEITDEEEVTGIASILPNTATNIYNWLLVGIAFVVIGGVLFIMQKRKTN